MEFLKSVLVIFLLTVALLVFIITVRNILLLICHNWPKYDTRGFDRKGIHKNGTRYDDDGFDFYGFDAHGYNRAGYDKAGYDREGYDSAGYTNCGRNAKGQYNRLHDKDAFADGPYSKDGFLNPREYPLILTTHAYERIGERIGVDSYIKMKALMQDAYKYGRSKRQIKKTSAALIEDIETRHDGGIVLIYRNYVYIFTADNKLKTVYKNERIPL